MATIPGKAKFDIPSLGKTINTSDPTLMNYIALYLTIKSGQKHVPNLSMLQDKEASDKRMKELNEIYARGERPPLAKKFTKKKKSENIYNNKNKKVKVKIIDKVSGDIYEFKSLKQAARFLSIKEGDKTESGYESLLHRRNEYKNYIFEIKGAYYKYAKSKFRPVVAENIRTGLKIEFETTNGCSKYLEKECEFKIYREKVIQAIENKKPLGEWIIRYKEEIK